MKRIWITGLILCAALAVTMTAQQRSSQTQAAEAALGAAIHQEEAEGNLEGAIASYKKFLSQYGNIRPLAAKAQYHLGLAYEKLGDAEARKAYERVTNQFADQKDVAAEAGRRLAALSISRSSDNGGPRLVLAGDDLDLGGISPDGRLTAMVEWTAGDGDLVIRDTATGQTKQLQKGACGRNSSNCRFADLPIVSPDSRQIAYTWYDETLFGGQGHLQIMAAEPGAKPRLLVGNPEFGIWARGWSSDGKTILATIRKRDRTWQIGLVSAADGSLKVLKSLDWRLQGDPSLSPDGRYIAYAAFPTNPSQPPPTRFESREQHIYVLATDGSKEVEIVKAAAANRSPLWIQDSSKLAFVSNLSGKFDLWGISLRDGNPSGSPLLLTRDIGENIMPVGVTRSGSYYYVVRKEGVEQVSIAELTSGGRSRIVETFVGVNPTWSPDGKSIAFSRHRGDNSDLVVRSTSTSDERAYLQGGLRAGPPRWFNDGKRLLQDVILPGRRRTSTSIDLTRGEFTPAHTSEFYLTGIAALSADGTFYFPSREPKNTANVFDRIMAVDLSSGKQAQAVAFPEVALGGFAFSVSPDGKMFATVMTDSKTRESRLSVIGVDGSGFRELYKPFRVVNAFDKLVWTKDGQSILFATAEEGNVNGDYQIMRIGIAGGKPEYTGLTVKGLSTFDVSPDGSRVAFSTLSGATHRFEFFALDNVTALFNDSRRR